MFKNLSDVKRKINIGNRVIIRNYIKDDFEEREVTNKNTISITTYSPTRISTSKSKIVNGAYQIVYGTDVILHWQKANETRILGNKIQFLANSSNCDESALEHLNKMNLDYWLELEIL